MLAGQTVRLGLSSEQPRHAGSAKGRWRTRMTGQLIKRGQGADADVPVE